ncbi:MAG: response regulator [Deltaproteobacteria bacterium]|nr:MAG: response regulator [Deltaproteobacteria bacterium]
MSASACARTVLIVEDDADTRDAIVEVLTDRNYRALEASNGADALDELRGAAPRPCVILLDMMMPVMDGKEFRNLQRVDEALREIPVVVLSAHADATGLAEQMEAAGFLRKPVDLVTLLQTVEQFCARD